jgi:hypothetical protein
MRFRATLAAAALTLTAVPVQALSLPSLAEGAMGPTVDGIERISNWKDGAPEAMRLEQCAAEGGQWVQLLKISACDQGQAEIDADGVKSVQACGPGHHGGEAELQCTHRDSQGRLYFNDGPSVPPAMLTVSSWIDDRVDQMRYNELFWPAGVAHDYCYHGNPITYGLSQVDCDERFIEDLIAACVHHESSDLPWFNMDICQTYAALMYGMVRNHGEESFSGYELEASYEQPEPLYQQLGMAESPYDERRRQEVQDLLVKFKIMPDPAKAD